MLSKEEREQRRLIQQADAAAAAHHAMSASHSDYSPVSPVKTPKTAAIIRGEEPPQVYSLLGSAALNSSSPADSVPPAKFDSPGSRARPETLSFPPPYPVPGSTKSPSTAGGHGKGHHGHSSRSKGGSRAGGGGSGSVMDVLSPRRVGVALDGDVKPGSAAAQAMQVERLTDKLDDVCGFDFVRSNNKG